VNTQPTPDRATRILAWVGRNQRAVIGAVAASLLVAGGVWFALSAKVRREAFAARALESARTAIEAGNLPLAGSDLARLTQTYGGTQAGDEAAILLAHVRLRQGDPQAAATGLRAALESGLDRQFVASANALLGGAHEQLGQMREAAEAYERAAGAAWYEYLAAEYLADAGRAFAASGDTARAAASFERLLQQYPKSPSVGEARVRLAELRAEAPAPGS
jgi:predicted negative regulator of RcsB-dependent stress response